MTNNEPGKSCDLAGGRAVTTSNVQNGIRPLDLAEKDADITDIE